MIDTIYKSVRFLARLAVFAFSLLALFGAVIVAVTQISAFRSWALNQGLDALNGELQGRIEVEDVSGNFITGLTLHNVRLIADSTTLIDAPEVELHYQLRPILSQQIVGTRVYLNRPSIKLIRNATDSSWNFDHITKPAVDSVKTPFNWDIDVDAFEIIDGTVQMHDLTVPQVIDTSSRNVDYAYLDIDHTNLAVQAHIEPTTQSVWIQHLSFDLPKPAIQLIELAGRFTVDTTGLTIRDFRLETERTKLAMEGRIDSINFLGVQKAVRPFIEYPMEVRMDAERVSTLELKRFIPDLAFLGGDPSLQLDADGTLGKLMINRLHLGLEDDSRINITGKLENLDHAEDILIDATITDTRLRDRDTRTYVPGLNLPDLRYLGTVDIKSASFSGPPENFVAKIDAATEVGEVRGGVQMDLRPAVTKYVGDVAIVHGNLGPIINDSRYESDFTGRAVINGEGFSLNELNSRVRLESQASRFAGRTYRKIYLDGVAQRNGYLKIDTLLVGFGDGGNATGADELVVDTVRGEYISPKLRTIFAEPLQLDAQDRSLLATGPFLGASGWLDLRKQIPSYDLYVRARDLNVEDITLNPEDRTRLTMTAHAVGSGFELDDLEGTGTVSVQRASTSGKNIPPFEATYTLTRTDERHRTLEFKSDFADAVISGEWRPEAVVPALSEGFGSIIDYINRKSSFQSEPFFAMQNRPFNESVNMHYDLVFRDLTPLEFFMAGEIDAIGHLSGDITGTPQILNISSAGRLDYFRYRDSSTTLAMDSAVINVDLRGITPERIGEITTIDISVRSDSAVVYNDLSFSAPEASIQLLNGEVKVHGATNINNQLSIAVDGIIDVNDPSGYRTVIDTLIVALPNGMQWRNYGPIRAVVAKDRIQLDSVAIQRRNREIVTINGVIAGERFENVEIAVLQGRLGSLPRFLSLSDPLSPISSISGAIRTFQFTLNGTFDDPRFTGTLAVDSLAYARNGVGDLRATLDYSNQNLTGKIAVINAPSAASPSDSALTVDIAAFPIDLAFASRQERLISGRPVQITARSNDLSLSPVGQLIPGATVSGGTIDLNFTMQGTFDELEYTGLGKISNGRILVEGNNIAYLLPHADLKFEDNVLEIDNTILRNDPREYPRGAASVKGKITFDGFSISNLDIQAETAGLLVLSDATQAVNDVVYGDLVIASQNGPIRFYGSLDQPYLEGDISVVLGDLIFPESTGRESNVNVVKYIDYEDWIKRTRKSYGPELPAEIDTAASKGDSIRTLDTATSPSGGLAGKLEDISRTLQQTLGEATGGKSLTDQIIMDLYITIPSRLFIEMKFSDFETLEAELSTEGLPLRFRRGSDGENHITGQVRVLPGSRYNFLKTFEATGNLNFTDQIDNVQLDLVATHNGRTLTGEGAAFREYSVIVYITGTKAKPVIKFSYTIDGRPPGVANQDEIDANALSLLLFGRTKDELVSASGGTGSLSQQALVGAGGQLGTGFVSSISSTVLAELLGSSRFIRSIELDLGNRASGDEARITVITQFGEVIIRYSGQISSPTNSTVTIDMPLANLLNLEALRNFATQLEIENSETSRAGFGTTESQAVRARIQYRYYW